MPWAYAAITAVEAVNAFNGTAEQKDRSAERWYAERKSVYSVDHGASWRWASYFAFALAAVLAVVQATT